MSVMQRRQYVFLASVLMKATLLIKTDKARNLVVELFMCELKKENPKFDRKRFIKACSEVFTS